MKRGTLLLLALVACFNLMAQNERVIFITDAVVMENRIKVPLSRKPAAVSVIDSTILKNSPGLSLADILVNVAGVDIRQRGINGIQTDAGIRGSSFDQVLVLVNGIRMGDSQTGHHNFNLPVDPDIIDRIEIFRGPSARVFGQNAFAGAINIITTLPDNNAVKIKTVTGSFGLFSGSASAALNTRTTKNHLSLSSQRSDGYRYNTDYNLSNLFYSGEVMTGAGNLTWMAGLSDRKFGANGFYSGPAYTDQYEEVTTTITSLSFTPTMKSSSVEMTARIYWRRNDDEYLLRRHDPDFYRNIHLNNTSGADFNIAYYSKAGITGAGLELTNSSIKSTRLGEHNRRGLSLFAEHRLTLFDQRVSLTPGIQLNHSTGFGISFLPGIDMGLTISEKLMLFINSGYTYRVPTFTDLYYEDPGNLGNPLLKPEYSLSHEAGIKTTKISWLNAQASLFTRRGSGLIDRIKDTEEEKWRPVNIRKTTFNGFESAVTIYPRQMQGNGWFPVSRFSAGYLFTSSGIDDITPGFSRFSLDNLRNQLLLSADLRYGKKLYHTITARYTDRVNSDDYIVADTRMTLIINDFTIFGEVSNIGGTIYHETWQVTMPGRWYKIGLSWKWLL
jgi:vitamin B12 transporter